MGKDTIKTHSRFTRFNPMIVKYSHMIPKDEDKESQVLKEMFEEIMRMIGVKQVRVESIMQRMVEQDTISQETFNRIYRMLTDHGKKKQWI
jgi:hypothetical protein